MTRDLVRPMSLKPLVFGDMCSVLSLFGLASLEVSRVQTSPTIKNGKCSGVFPQWHLLTEIQWFEILRA